MIQKLLPRPKSVLIDGQVEIKARVAENDSPSFVIQAYNGGKLPVDGFSHPVVVELKTAVFEKPVIKINRNHDQQRELGHTTDQTINANGITLVGLLSVPSDDRNEIIEAAGDGFPWDASIEAIFPKPEFIRAGRSVVVNGETQSGPFYLARNATITGTAILNRGADRNTVVQIAAEDGKGVEGQGTGESVRAEIERLKSGGMTLKEIGAQVDRDESTLGAILSGEIANPPESLLSALRKMKSKQKGKDMNASLKTFIESKGFDPAGLNTEQISVLETLHASEGGEMNAMERQRNDAANEMDRVSEIQSICANAPTIEIKDSEGKKKIVPLASHAIRSGMTTDECRLHARIHEVSQASPVGGAPGAFHGYDQMNAEDEQQTLEAAIAMNVAQVDPDKAAKQWGEEAIDRASSNVMRSQSLHSVMGRICASAGRPWAGPTKTMDYWKHTVECMNVLQASGTSTLSLPNLFENVLNKTSQDEFELQDQTWREFVHIGSATDFKATSKVRLTADGGYQRIESDGEIKHVSLTDSKRSNQLETFGAMMSLSRKDIINDDLGRLTGASAFLGQMAGVKLNEDVFVKLLSGTGFFTAGNKNLVAETLTLDGMAAVRDAFINRVNANKKPINVQPAILLHGVPLTDIAGALYTKTEFAVGNTTTGDKLVSNKNNHVGKYKPLMSPYLSNTDIRDCNGKALTGQSDDLWFLISAPRQMIHAIEVIFLNGMQSPTNNSGDMEFNKLGMQYRSYHDFGCEFGDPEAIVKSQP